MAREPRRVRSTALMQALALLVVVSTLAAAEQIEPSSLPAREAQGMLGKWLLTVDLPNGDEMHLVLDLVDVGGKLAATIGTPEQTRAQVVTDITEASLALKLRYAAQFGETSTGMTLIVRSLDPGTLTGSLTDDLGLLAADASADARARGLGLFAARVRGVRGGKVPGRTALDLAGREVRITFGGLSKDSPDHERFRRLADGEVFEFAGSRATKLFTAADLGFGNTTVKTANASPDFASYPGVYSLWLKKVGAGWHLVFNEQADVWGTQHDPEFDVAEIPLTLSESGEARDRLEIELTERGEGGVLQLAWGSQRWEAPFVVRR